MSGGGSTPGLRSTASDWVNMVNNYQHGALSTRLGIPMIYGIDAVHGHNTVYNATIFPHNVGLGVTRQDALIIIIDLFFLFINNVNPVNLFGYKFLLPGIPSL